MQTIEVTTPLIVDKIKVASIQIDKMNFLQFITVVDNALADVTGTSVQTLLRRGRMLAQCKFVGTDGTKVPFTALEIMKLPIAIGRTVADACDKEDGEPGTILSADDADGIEKPIRYQLGTPIEAADGKSIAELEFQARTYGDVEDVLSETAIYAQTRVLIEKVAKPEGMLQLPSWAAAGISAADGVFIAQKILPRFLG